MAGPTPPRSRSLLAAWLDEESLLPERVRQVLRLDPTVYADIEADPHALPGAFTVVLATAVCVGLGQPSLARIFLGIAGAIVVWGATSGLVWAFGTLLSRDQESGDYPGLLRCTGFAFAWNVLALGASLPAVGFLLEWGGVVLWAVSLVLATRQVFRMTTGWAAIVCALALLAPFLLLALVS